MKELWPLLALALACGCGDPPRRPSDAPLAAPPPVSRDRPAGDEQVAPAAEDLVAYLEQAYARPPLLRLTEVINDTTHHLDPTALADEVTSRLLAADAARVLGPEADPGRAEVVVRGRLVEDVFATPRDELTETVTRRFTFSLTLVDAKTQLARHVSRSTWELEEVRRRN